MAAKKHFDYTPKRAVESGKLNVLKKAHKGKKPSQITKPDVDAYCKQKMIMELGLEETV